MPMGMLMARRSATRARNAAMGNSPRRWDMQTRRWHVPRNNVAFGEGMVLGTFIGMAFMGIQWMLVGR